MTDQLLFLLGTALVGLLIWAALAPFEALGWWAGWFGDKIYQYEGDPVASAYNPQAVADSYLIFLSGVSRVSGETMSRREQNFLRKLAAVMPNTVIIDNVFPYSINNLPLTGQPVFAGIWRWALKRKLSRHWLEGLAGYLINLRNIWQVAISVDKRYGPIYNQGMAQVLVQVLLQHGYDLNTKRPVVLMGYSGAGQIALGASTYVKEEIGAPVFVISLGGIFGSDPGLLAADHIYHIYGQQDRPQRLGQLLFPGRWPIFFYSAWNRALRTGRVTAIPLVGVSHSGGTGYLTTSRTLSDGHTHLDKTVSIIASLPFHSYSTLPDLSSAVLASSVNSSSPG